MTAKGKSVITVLDIGTSKIACLMARMKEGNRPEIIGYSCVPAKGIQAGAIWDTESAKICIDEALRQAEKMVKRPITSIFVNISSSQLKSIQLYQEIDIPGGRAISAEDVKSLVDGMLKNQIPAGEEVLHAIPVGYVVDREQGHTDPRGLHGNTLGARLHVITIPETQTLNLLKVLDWCHVNVAVKVATPYAAALSVLTEDEMDLGATVLDLGSGMTSYAILLGGGIMQLGVIPKGGSQITRAIAQTFNTDLKNAERMKILNGAAFLSPRDEVDPVIVPILGDDTGANIQIMRSDLISVVVPELENILTSVQDVLEEDETFSSVARRFVLTGGGSGFAGIQEKVTSILGGPARIGHAKQIKSLPNEYDSCTFNICVGLLVYAMLWCQDKLYDDFQSRPASGNWLGRVKEWLKQHL